MTAITAIIETVVNFVTIPDFLSWAAPIAYAIALAAVFAAIIKIILNAVFGGKKRIGWVVLSKSFRYTFAYAMIIWVLRDIPQIVVGWEDMATLASPLWPAYLTTPVFLIFSYLFLWVNTI